MRIVFMGTPDFAAASLKKLLGTEHEIAAVFTQPDKPGNRRVLTAPPVKTLAIAHGVPVYQPATLRDGTALEILQGLAPELIVVVAYGRILPDDILAVPPKGCVNVHGSLLPKYRGSAPIQWAVLNGDRETGVTTMYVSSEMDAGDLIFSRKTEIGEFETAGELFERLSALGAELLAETLSAIASGTAPRTPQKADEATYTTQLDKSLSPIDWGKTPREIVKHICGLQPWPVATARFYSGSGETLRVFAAEYTQARTQLSPGSVVSAGNAGIEVACGGGETLLLTEIQAPGKKRMRAADWLRGHPLEIG